MGLFLSFISSCKNILKAQHTLSKRFMASCVHVISLGFHVLDLYRVHYHTTVTEYYAWYLASFSFYSEGGHTLHCIFKNYVYSIDPLSGFYSSNESHYLGIHCCIHTLYISNGAQTIIYF